MARRHQVETVAEQNRAKISLYSFRKDVWQFFGVVWHLCRLHCHAILLSGREGKLLHWRQQLEAASGTHAKGFCPGELVFGMAAPARSNVRRNHES